MVTHLESDVLECEVRWALGSNIMNKASGDDEFQLSYFRSLKMMRLKCYTQHVSKFEKLSSGHRTRKSVFIPLPKKGSAKECTYYWIIALTSHAKVMLKILKLGFSSP